MALIKNIVLKDNFGDDKEFANAYLKIEHLSGNKTEMSFSLGIYRGKDNKKIDNQQFIFVPNLDGENFIKQAYNHLKTLPEFAGATDC